MLIFKEGRFLTLLMIGAAQSSYCRTNLSLVVIYMRALLKSNC